MELLYLGYACDPKLFELLSQKDSDISVASHKYELCLLHELEKLCMSENHTKECNVRIISYLPVKNIDLDIFPGKLFDFSIDYVNCERNDIKALFLCVLKARNLIKNWLSKTSGKERIILSYATNPVLLGALLSFYHRPPVVTICSEVPSLRIMTNGSKVINKIKKMVFAFLNDNMNGYVFMSKHMNDICNKKKKPWIVVEGMVKTDNLQIKQDRHVPRQQNTLFYAGGLFAEYGIDVLLESAALLESHNVDFILCGDGNSRPLVEEYSQKHRNIHYLGLKKNDEVIQIEKSVTLLINPRKPDNIISKYSFPSKTYEYFASGTPCIITKMEGIPDEYYEFCYICDVTNAETLAKSILDVLSIPIEERQRKADKALAFLKEKKSAAAQAMRILDFLEEMVAK